MRGDFYEEANFKPGIITNRQYVLDRFTSLLSIRFSKHRLGWFLQQNCCGLALSGWKIGSELFHPDFRLFYGPF